MLNQSEASKPELHAATFGVCFILLVPIIILGTSANVVAILRIMRLPRVRKVYSTIVHLLFLATAACGFVCPLELVQLLENYFHVGLMSTCVLKLFLRVLLQVSSFSCSVVIAWERMQKIRGHTRRNQCMCHKYLLFSFMWLLIIPYALYNMVHSMYQDVPQLLVQVCHLKHVVRENMPQAAHQHLLPLLFLVSLTTTGIIYKQGCLKAEAQHKKTTANKNNKLNPFAMLKRPRESVLSQSADMFSIGNKDLDLSPKLPQRKGDEKPPLEQNSTMKIHTVQRKNSQVLDPPTEHEKPDMQSNGVGTPTETDLTSLTTDPPPTVKADSSTESAFRNVTNLGSLPGKISTILEVPRAEDQICLKPLRHTRLTAGSSWKTVRDAFESKRIKSLGKGSDNKVKRFKPVLTKSDSSWSLTSFMEPTESPSIMKKRFRSRRTLYNNSQKWQLESMSAEVDKMTEFNSIALDNTFMPGNDDDLANLKLHKSEYKHLSAVTKRNVFKSLKSSCKLDADIPVAWKSQLQINTSILQCEQTPTEKVVPENLGQPDSRMTDDASCAELDRNCAMNQGSVNMLVGNIYKIHGNDNSHIISKETDEILSDSGDTFKTDQQKNCTNVQSMRIIRPSTDPQPRTSQTCMIDLSLDSLNVGSISNAALMPGSQSSSGRSYPSRFQPAHSKKDKAIWTKATVTILINRSLLLVSVFAVCFLPISVVHVFSAHLSDKALINIYPLVCCIEYVYYAIIPILLFSQTNL